jgi:hypothetical protein
MQYQHPVRPSWLLTSPGFLAGLALLLLNDLVLKHAYPGLITGKLSDVAGLWVFPMFWCVFSPRRATPIYVATALLFALWKSPLSQPLLDAWNGASPFAVGRVSDATDLLAMVVLPLSAAYARRVSAAPPVRSLRTTAAPAVMLLALFAFSATSQVPLEYGLAYGESDPANVFHFNVPKDDLILALNTAHVDQLGRQFRTPDPPFFSFMIEVRLKATVCDRYGYVNGLAEFRDTGDDKSVIVLTTMLAPCKHPEKYRDQLRDAYRKEVIDVLHNTVHDQ